MNTNILSEKSGLFLSRHAVQMAQQRGIRHKTLQFVVDHSDREFHAGEGRRSRRISEKGIARLIAAGEKPSEAERARNVVILVDSSGSKIITVMRDRGNKAGRCYRSQWPTRSIKRRLMRQQNARRLQRETENSADVYNDADQPFLVPGYATGPITGDRSIDLHY